MQRIRALIVLGSSGILKISSPSLCNTFSIPGKIALCVTEWVFKLLCDDDGEAMRSLGHAGICGMPRVEEHSEGGLKGADSSNTCGRYETFVGWYRRTQVWLYDVGSLFLVGRVAWYLKIEIGTSPNLGESVPTELG